MPENILLTDVLHGGTNSLRTEITNTPVVTNVNIDIALSALRDAITKTGETVKTLADVVDKLSDVGVTSLPSLIAGNEIVGKVGIDQTTPGTTNAVVNKNASGNEIFTDGNPGSMKLTGSLICKETNKVVAVATDILNDYTATINTNSTLMVMTNTVGILSLEVDAVLGSLNSAVALDTGKWYAFDIPITATSVYNLQFSAIATMQIKWIGGI